MNRPPVPLPPGGNQSNNDAAQQQQPPMSRPPRPALTSQHQHQQHHHHHQHHHHAASLFQLNPRHLGIGTHRVPPGPLGASSPYATGAVFNNNSGNNAISTGLTRAPTTESSPQRFGDNVLFEVMMQLPRGGGSVSTSNNDNNNNSNNSSNSNTSDAEEVFDEFHVRIWGPRDLFTESAQEEQNQHDEGGQQDTFNADTTHRLVFFLHGAGMSSMSFHLLACHMLGVAGAQQSHQQQQQPAAGGPQIETIQVTLPPADASPSPPPPPTSEETTANATTTTTSSATAPPQTNNNSNSSNTRRAKAPRIICAALDFRAHGKTKFSVVGGAGSGRAASSSSSSSAVSDDDDSSHSGSSNHSFPSCDIDDLASDASRVMERIFQLGRFEGQQRSSSFSISSSVCKNLCWAADRAVCLVGHSLGGSIASFLSEQARWRQQLFGLVLLDIVEGTAIDSIRHMPEFLRRRPSSFRSPQEAVNWFVRQGGYRSSVAAAVSVPTLLKREDDTSSAGNEQQQQHQHPQDEHQTESQQQQSDAAASSSSSSASSRRLTWITDLAATQPFWESWFAGMDARFLHAVCPRMLCLSSPDKLDRDLTVAHMQGQFQFEIFRECGHYIHEDAPDLVAPVLLRFIHRIEQQQDKLKAVFLKKFGGGAGDGAAGGGAASVANQ